jgi:hypothetical protein
MQTRSNRAALLLALLLLGSASICSPASTAGAPDSESGTDSAPAIGSEEQPDAGSPDGELSRGEGEEDFPPKAKPRREAAQRHRHRPALGFRV